MNNNNDNKLRNNFEKINESKTLASQNKNVILPSLRTMFANLYASNFSVKNIMNAGNKLINKDLENIFRQNSKNTTKIPNDNKCFMIKNNSDAKKGETKSGSKNRKCQIEDCNKYSKRGGFCIKHGGGNRTN